MALLNYTYVFSPELDQLGWGDALITWDSAMIDGQGELYGLVLYSRTDYRDALAALLPEGEVWPRDPSSTLMKVLGSLAVEFERLDARAAQLLAEADPTTTSELLADWEALVGLPDPCVSAPQTVAERRLALQGRLTSVGGQSKAFFIQLAARLGYIVTIDEFASAAAATAAGITFTGSEWAHIWRVNVPVSVGVRHFQVGGSTVGEPLRSWGNQVIECQFNRFKPAHTRVLFAYAT